MSSITINPGDYTGGAFNGLQNMIDNNDEINFKAGTYDIGSKTILVRDPKKFKGVSGSSLIKGTSGYLMANVIPTIANPSSKLGAGIFSILGNGTVEITGINFEHTPDPSPAPLPDGNFTHGSGTIAYFVDNNMRSSLMITDCVIDTSATGAINIDSINGAALSGPPITHDFTIRGCKIPGRYPAAPHPLADPTFGGGNWLSVKLGPMPPATPSTTVNPVDMRDSYFEVSDCHLDPATFAAIAVWLCESNSETEFVISNNKIAQSPTAGALDYGVFLGFPIPTNAPNGTAVIQDNKIQVGDYFQFGGEFSSYGILVNVSNDKADKKIRTVIVGTTVSLTHSPPQQPDITFAGGISYQDLANGGSQNVTALIDENTINGGSTAPPRWGIALRGPAHDFVVNDNHLESLNSGVAQIYIEKDAHDGILSGNVLGQLKAIVSAGSAIPPEAVIFCDGDNNRFFDNDFDPSLAPGWSPHHTGPGYFKLGSNSKNNILVDQTLDPHQFLDMVRRSKPKCMTTNHMLHL